MLSILIYLIDNDICFKGGFIDAWGRGTLKIIEACKQAELPEPEIKEEDGGIIVTLFKDCYMNILHIHSTNAHKTGIMLSCLNNCKDPKWR